VYQPFKPSVPAVTANDAVGPILSNLTVVSRMVVRPASFAGLLKMALLSRWSELVAGAGHVVTDGIRARVLTVTLFVYQPFDRVCLL
jgi:hypothetical protein